MTMISMIGQLKIVRSDAQSMYLKLYFNTFYLSIL